MQTYFDVESLAARLTDGSAVTWGNFDGVHLGHQALIGRLTAHAGRLGLPSVVMTFEPRPVAFFKGAAAPRSITDLDDKLKLLAKLGVDYTLVLPFDRHFASVTAESFVRDILVASLRAKALILGYDVSFGKGKGGDFAYLQEVRALYGFELEQAPPVIIDAAVVASTRVRGELAKGNLPVLPRLLGRRHSVHGAVTHGMQRGSTILNIPTANLAPGNLLLPPLGVYACLARIGGHEYAAATSLGTNPSFKSEGVTLEAHLISCEGDLYGQDMRLYFLEFLRPEKAFSDLELLTEQIYEDIDKTASVVAAAQAGDDFRTMFPL